MQAQSLVTTLGILLANFDERRDYLANFEPFVQDRLASWPVDKPVGAKDLGAELSGTFSFPPIPLNTVTELIRRTEKAGFLERRGVNNKLYPNPRKLKDVDSDVLRGRTEALAHFEALGDGLRAYAKENVGLTWSEQETDHALETFIAEFGIEMAEARRDGELSGQRAWKEREMLAVVHGYARHCLKRDAVQFGYLEDMVRGSMLTNLLYFRDLGSWTPKLESLVVFLDTPVALRLLGLSPEELSLGAQELMDMLEADKVPVRVFEHTVSEMIGVLEGVRANLERARQQQLDLNSLKNLNREVIEHLMKSGWGPSDVQAVISDIDGQLAAKRIAIEPTPPYTRELSVDDGRFEKILLDRHFTKSQVGMDIKSITAVHRLRKGRTARSLGKAGAVFVTPNPGLVRASGYFFKEQGLQSPVGHCMVDVSLTTQLWLAAPSQEREGVPRKMLIAECYAALDPPQNVWNKYLEKIDVRRRAGVVTEEQVKTLVFSTTAQEGLFELTHNDPKLIDDETPQRVLERYEEAIREPAEIEIRKAADQLASEQAESEALRAEIEAGVAKVKERDGELDAQRERLRALEKWKTESDAERAQRGRLIHRTVGSLAALAILVAGALLLATETISGSLGFSIVVFASVALALLALGWGWVRERPLEWTRRKLIAAGATLALFFGIYEVTQRFMG